MGAPQLTADDFTEALLAMLPTGRVWPRDPGTTIRATLAGLSPTYARNLQRANDLLTDSFPLTTVELLPEWEESLGLPDPCAGPQPTIEARRAQVVARFAHSGGQSVAYFIAYALTLGYVVTIEQYAPFRAGIDHAGDPLYGEDWAFTWTIHAPLTSIEYFRAGISTAGEPLAYWSNQVLECELTDLKPAHTILLFAYS